MFICYFSKSQNIDSVFMLFICFSMPYHEITLLQNGNAEQNIIKDAFKCISDQKMSKNSSGKYLYWYDSRMLEASRNLSKRETGSAIHAPDHAIDLAAYNPTFTTDESAPEFTSIRHIE